MLMLNGFNYLLNFFWILILMNRIDIFFDFVEVKFQREEEKLGGNKISFYQ